MTPTPRFDRVTDDRIPFVLTLASGFHESGYATHRLESRPLIRIAIERLTDWGALQEPEA